MSTGGTIEAMTPLRKKTQYYWYCQRPKCGHEWPAKDVNQEPKRCAKCKRKDWNRETKSVGRPRNDEHGGKPNPRGNEGIGFEAIMKRKADAKRGPKVKANKAKRGRK